MLISPEILQKVLRWNSLYSIDFPEDKNPYLSYTINVRCKNLNPVKLSKKQLDLYKKICELRDEGLTYKQISDKLNKLGIPPTRGKAGEFTPQKVWSSYTKIKKNLDRKDNYHPPDIEDVELVWE